MRPMAQMAMVMNLDKCIGCHTCSVTCKQAWTNRSGVEYVWFNNVESRPGQGYPRTYQDQERWQGGWVRTRGGRLRPRSGGRLRRLLSIFANPKLPAMADYYEPWTYDYEHLLTAPAGEDTPVARPRSLLTGRPTKITWSANWDDSLAGGNAVAAGDPILAQVSGRVRQEYERAFLFFLPRICEHCLNPSCAAACPSGAIYKRYEDGIVLVDSDRCRGWRMCVTGCPYKKVYFNHRTGKAEKCTFCFPRIEIGQPTICSETCVGRLRYLGLMLYDADAVSRAAAVADPGDLYEAQRSVFLDPHDPAVAAAASRAGIPDDWIDAARRSPVWDLIMKYRVALPLHPEYRTMPMVWYIPPLSPVVDVLRDTGHDGEDAGNLFGAVDALRIPVDYLAGLFTAGDPAPVRAVLNRLAAMRAYQRRVNLGERRDESIAAAVGVTGQQLDDMYRLLAIAKYDERYVIPAAHAEDAHRLEALASECSVPGGYGASGGYGSSGESGGYGVSGESGASGVSGGYGARGGSGPFGEASGQPAPVQVETFHMLRERQTADTFTDPGDPPRRVNLLNWDGKGRPAGLFPPRRPTQTRSGGDVPHSGEDESSSGGDAPRSGDDAPRSGGDVPHSGGDVPRSDEDGGEVR